MKTTEISKNTTMNKENGIIINGKKYIATAGRSCEKCAFGHGKYQYCNSFCVAFSQDLLGLNEEIIFKAVEE